tara:strand:+ start:8053 stop:9171 length:1119 start_codon:yes stop_codon:yes gene_type:complete
MQTKKIIVISGVNIVEAGPLSVMRDFLKELSKTNDDALEIIALVNSESLFDFPNIKYLEFPNSKKNWFYRIYHEYYHFKKLSLELKPTIWISMHDITPNVSCDNLYVYCHNATPYYKPTWKDWIYGGRASLFSLFYIYLYGINIKRNKGVIVQQDWLRKEFEERFNLKNVIVAYPDIDLSDIKPYYSNQKLDDTIKKIFFPSFPRSFKNFEVICEAYKKLPEEYKASLNIYITLDQNLNSYAKYIYKKYKNQKGLCFIGLLDRKEVFKYYEQVDALVFPSKLESWGLPITEFKKFKKPIFLSNLPYAKETLGAYEKGYFFDPKDPSELMDLMKLLIDQNLKPNSTQEIKIKDPFFIGWKNLFKYLINDENLK